MHYTGHEINKVVYTIVDQTPVPMSMVVRFETKLLNYRNDDKGSLFPYNEEKHILNCIFRTFQ